MDRLKYQLEGIKWLAELELLNNPQLINNIKLNILVASKQIKEVELLIYRENKTMLVLLELSWFGRKFLKRSIFEEVEDSLSQMLPSFRFRVTDDPKIMELAVARVKQALTGGKNENNINSSDVPNKSASEQQPTNSNPEGSTSTRSNQSNGSDQKEQPVSGEPVHNSVGPDDSKKEQKS